MRLENRVSANNLFMEISTRDDSFFRVLTNRQREYVSVGTARVFVLLSAPRHNCGLRISVTNLEVLIFFSSIQSLCTTDKSQRPERY